MSNENSKTNTVIMAATAAGTTAASSLLTAAGGGVSIVAAPISIPVMLTWISIGYLACKMGDWLSD